MFDIRILIDNLENQAIKQLVINELWSNREKKRELPQNNDHAEDTYNSYHHQIKIDEVVSEYNIKKNLHYRNKNSKLDEY